MSRPSDCARCESEFMSRPALQAEVRHTAVKEGVAAAEMDMNEALAEYHEDHEEDNK